MLAPHLRRQSCNPLTSPTDHSYVPKYLQARCFIIFVSFVKLKFAVERHREWACRPLPSMLLLSWEMNVTSHPHSQRDWLMLCSPSESSEKLISIQKIKEVLYHTAIFAFCMKTLMPSQQSEKYLFCATYSCVKINPLCKNPSSVKEIVRQCDQNLST